MDPETAGLWRDHERATTSATGVTSTIEMRARSGFEIQDLCSALSSLLFSEAQSAVCPSARPPRRGQGPTRREDVTDPRCRPTSELEQCLGTCFTELSPEPGKALSVSRKSGPTSVNALNDYDTEQNSHTAAAAAESQTDVLAQWQWASGPIHES